MKGFVFLFCVLFLALSACNNRRCVDGLDLKPMYGGVARCEKQQEMDRNFVRDCVAQYGSKKQACEEMLRFAWKHYAAGNMDLSMRRFNQAWLLDSLNAEAYLGFGAVLTDRGSFGEAASFYDRSLRLDSTDLQALKLTAGNLEALFCAKGDSLLLQRELVLLHRAMRVKPDDAGVYAALMDFYIDRGCCDSAKWYMNRVSVFDPDWITNGMRLRVVNCNRDSLRR